VLISTLDRAIVALSVSLKGQIQRKSPLTQKKEISCRSPEIVPTRGMGHVRSPDVRNARKSVQENMHRILSNDRMSFLKRYWHSGSEA